MVNRQCIWFFSDFAQCSLLGIVVFHVLYLICSKKWMERRGGGSAGKAFVMQEWGVEVYPQHPSWWCRMFMVTCETSCIDELWVQVRDPAPIHIVENDWGRHSVPTSDLHRHTHTYMSKNLPTCTLTHMQTCTYACIHTQTHTSSTTERCSSLTNRWSDYPCKWRWEKDKKR